MVGVPEAGKRTSFLMRGRTWHLALGGLLGHVDPPFRVLRSTRDLIALERLVSNPGSPQLHAALRICAVYRFALSRHDYCNIMLIPLLCIDAFLMACEMPRFTDFFRILSRASARNSETRLVIS